MPKAGDAVSARPNADPHRGGIVTMPHAIRMLAAATAVGGLALSGLMTAGAASASIHGPGTHGPGSRYARPGTGPHAIGRVTPAPPSNPSVARDPTPVTAGTAAPAAANLPLPPLSRPT